MVKHIKAQTLLPQREAEICQRVQAIRQSLKFGQPEFARELNIPRGRLASYEYQKAPIRFLLGYALCQQFNVSLRWLACGEGQMWLFTPISKVLLSAITERELFSSVYDEQLAKTVAAHLDELKKGAPPGSVTISNRRLGVPLAQSYFEQVHDHIAFAAAQMPDETKKSFAHKLSDLVFAYFPWDKECKLKIDITCDDGNLGGVSADVPNWDELVAKVKRLAKERGAKAALAAELKTSRQNVNKWLAGDGAPSAELTLSLLRWVRKRANQQK